MNNDTINTAVLNVRELARHMHRVAGEAFEEDIRATGSTDETILGKLTMLDVICDPIWVSGDCPMTSEETHLLGAARDELHAACDFLDARIKSRGSEGVPRHLAESRKVPV